MLNLAVNLRIFISKAISVYKFIMPDGRHTMISTIEDNELRGEILTETVPLPPVAQDEAPQPNSGTDKFSQFVSVDYNPFIRDIEDIKRFETTKNGRIYLKFQDEFNQLEIVKFKISAVNYLSINSHIIKLSDFVQIHSIEFNDDDASKRAIARNGSDRHTVHVIFENGQEFRFQGCSVNLFVKALSDDALLVERPPEYTILSDIMNTIGEFFNCSKRKFKLL